MTINHGRIEADRGRGGKIPPIPPTKSHPGQNTSILHKKTDFTKKYVAPIGILSGGDIIMFNYSCNDA